MQFIALMRALMALKAVASDMSWVVKDGRVYVEFSVPAHVQTLMQQGRQMFTPR